MLNYLAKQVKAAYLNVTEIELKVIDATNDEPWGPTGSEMSEIARLAEDRDNYSQIMNILHQRLMETGANWRLCYKALLILDFLCKQGPLRVADDLLRSIHILERLRDMFEYKDPQGKDHGVNVRQRAKDLVALVNSPQRLSEERIKASKNSGKYKGVSSDDMKYKGVGSNFTQGDTPTNGNIYMGQAGFVSGGGRGDFGAPPPPTQTGQPAWRPSGADAEEDPFEATRKRIEKLKAEGGNVVQANDKLKLEGGLGADDAVGSFAPTFRELPSENEAKKGPKKLSEVKVNAQFLNTFANIAQKQGVGPARIPQISGPPGAAPAVDFLGGRSGGGSIVAPPSAASDPFADFLADPMPAPAAAPTTATSNIADPFGAPGPAATPAASSDPFSTFMSAPPAPSPPTFPTATARPPASLDPFGTLAAPPLGSQSAPPQSFASAAAALDPFSSLTAAPASAAPRAPMPSSDPFSNFSAASPAAAAACSFVGTSGTNGSTSADPFGAFSPIPTATPIMVGLPGGMGMGAGVSQPMFGVSSHPVSHPMSIGAPSLGGALMNGSSVDKPKAKDPFAGLGFD